ncbi:MAG: M61 family metallopeptidase [Fimbriimonadia bacterium]
MRRYSYRAVIASLVLLLWACAFAVVEYTVSAAPGQTYVGVEIVASVKGDSIRFQIPSWTPGAYIRQRHFRAIDDVKAQGADGSELIVTREDDITWSVFAPGQKKLVMTYRVTRDAIPNAGLQIAGPATYMYVVDRKDEACSVHFAIPVGWRVAIGLDPAGKNTYRAPNYDVLADAPAQLGHFNVDEFRVRGVTHQCVTFGEGADQVDRKRLVAVCKRIAESQTAFFDDIPYRRYVFLFSVRPGADGGGGLEHLNSTSIWMSAGLGPRVVHVIAHEFFHLWNVKRIRPAVLGPFDYTGPALTRNLWWSEGVTDYYATVLNQRAGLLSRDEFFATWGRDILRLQQNPSRLKVSADECSLRTWEGGTHSGYGGLDYYLKGKLVGLCLDLKMRDLTDGRRSLDDVMRLLYEKCGRGIGPGFAEDGIRDACIELGGPEMGPFYDKVARSTDELPFREIFAAFGIRCTMRTDENNRVESVSVTPMTEITRRQERLRDGWLNGKVGAVAARPLPETTSTSMTARPVAATAW